MPFSHLDEQGRVLMVDVGEKAVTHREAKAQGTIRMSAACFAAITENRAARGNVLTTAEIAGIMAAKRTGETIPLCHTLALNVCKITFTPDENNHAITAVCTVACDGKTGAEMEALHGASVALLTIYDMCKAIDRSMVIDGLRLLEKSGGKSGTYRCEV